MQDHQEMLDNIPAYALGALDAEEAKILVDHMASCAECQAEYRLYQQATDQIGLGAPETTPAREIKNRLFSQIRPAQTPAEKSSQWRQWFSQRPALALVSVGIILVLAVSNLLLWGQVRDLSAQTFRVVNLSATEVIPDAAGMIIISADGKHGTLVASNLTELPEDLQYQLWLIKDGARTSGGIFSVASSGYAALQVYAPLPLDSYNGFGITIEPFGGSPGPTGDKVLGGEY